MTKFDPSERARFSFALLPDPAQRLRDAHERAKLDDPRLTLSEFAERLITAGLDALEAESGDGPGAAAA